MSLRSSAASRAGRRVAAASLAVSLAVSVAGCSASTGNSAGGSGFVYADSTTALVKQADRKPAPTIPSTLLGGKPTPSTAGKVVLLNVWASWCGPCRHEATALQRIQDALGNKGVVVLGVNTRDQSAAATAFITRLGITYGSVADEDGSAFLGGFAGVVPKIYTPTSIVLDKQGRIAGWALGEADYSKFRGLLDPLLAESAK